MRTLLVEDPTLLVAETVEVLVRERVLGVHGGRVERVELHHDARVHLRARRDGRRVGLARRIAEAELHLERHCNLLRDVHVSVDAVGRRDQ